MSNPPSSVPAATVSPFLLKALLFGNLVVGMGVMAVPATLTTISEDMGTPIATTGQLMTAAAVLMGVGAPLFAARFSKSNRRLLLSLSLAWYALFHLLCAVLPSLLSSFAVLMVLRVVAMVTPAIFTPQAAAVVGQLSTNAERAKFITFIFLGWSVSSVFGVPLLSAIGGTWGWQYAFGLVSILAVIGALWIWREMPHDVPVQRLSSADWGRVFKNSELMLTVTATLLSAFAQFTLFAYFTAYYKEVLGAGVVVVSLLFFGFGAFGLLGNVLLSRHFQRIGADRAPIVAMGLMALSLLAWPLGAWVLGGTSLQLSASAALLVVLIVLLPWGLGCFAGNSSQQARLAMIAPDLAGASVALNTSAIYGGQALGAALGGYWIAHASSTAEGLQDLSWLGFGIMLAAIAVSHASRTRVTSPST